MCMRVWAHMCVCVCLHGHEYFRTTVRHKASDTATSYKDLSRVGQAHAPPPNAQ